MSTAPQRSPSGLRESDEHEGSQTTQVTAQAPAVRRRVRRFEFGFFVRKIRFGRLAYYKELLLLKKLKHEKGADSPPPPPPENPQHPSPAPRMMMAHEAPDPTMEEQTGTSIDTGDPGPIGGTRYEAGFFAGTTSTSPD